MKKVLLVLVSVLMVFSLLGCGSKEEKVEEEEKVLVIYSAADEDFLELVIPAFEEETGITVEIQDGGAGEIFKRIAAEAENPLCDVQLGSTEDVARKYLDYCEAYTSIYDGNVYPDYSSKTFDGKLTPYECDSAIFMYNKDLTEEEKVNGYEKLTDESLKGQVSIPDPNASGTGVGIIQDYIRIFGDGTMESEEGWAMLEKFLRNLDGKLGSGSGAAANAVINGEAAVTITYEAKAFNSIKDGANVGVCYPLEGVSFSVGVVNIVKGAPHIENAKLFIDFMLSEKVQNILTNDLSIRSVRTDVTLGEGIPTIDTIKTIDCDHEYLSETQEATIERYNDLWAEIN